MLGDSGMPLSAATCVLDDFTAFVPSAGGAACYLQAVRILPGVSVICYRRRSGEIDPYRGL